MNVPPELARLAIPLALTVLSSCGAPDASPTDAGAPTDARPPPTDAGPSRIPDASQPAPPTTDAEPPRTPPPVTPNVVVDFDSRGFATSALSVGSCISTYANGGTNLIKGAAQTSWRQYLSDLGPLVWRIPLYYHDGQVGSAAGGIHGGDEGAAYIQAIRAIHGIPMIVVGGSTNDNDIRASDAAALVHYFDDGGGAHGGPVDHYVIGNEPDNGFGLDNYLTGGSGSDGYIAIVEAMRAATTRRLTIAGPALVTWADYKFADYRQFLDLALAQTDVIDFHKYGDGSRTDNVNRTAQYADAVSWLRAEVAARDSARADTVGIQVGEFNYNPFYAGWSDAFYTSRNTVHTASVIGRMLSSGGRAYQYSDNNGPLGLITDGTGNNDQPAGEYVRLPAYWGVSVWSGGVFHPRFGTVMVSATTTIPDFEVYATDDAAMIVLINRSDTTSQRATVELRGSHGYGYSEWRYPTGMDATAFATGPQFQPPVQRVTSAALTGDWLQTDVEPMSVTVVHLE